MPSQTSIFTFALALGSLILGTNAGAEAHVNACVYYAQPIIRPFEVRFSVPTSVYHCMYQGGHNANVLVTRAGLTCASLGVVESKASSSGGDLCATDESRWGVSYNAGPISGTTYSTWHAPIFSRNHIDLYGQSANTYICGSEARCSNTEITVNSDGQSRVYIIFEPSSFPLEGRSDENQVETPFKA